MHKSFYLKLSVLLFLPFHLIAYDFSFQKEDNLLKIDFEDNLIKEIKFDLKINGQRNFGIINYHNNEIYILLNTDQISFDNFKKVFPKPQENKKLNKKINFNWEISEMKISEDYSLYSNKLNFIYDEGFESMMFYDSKREFELSILPQLEGDKQIYLFSKNAGQFFYAQKISKNMNGGALIGKGSFRKFNDYDLNIKVKDFSIDKNSKFYNLLFTSRMLDIFSVLQNSQDEFNYLEVPVRRKGKVFSFDHAIMLGGTVAFSFKGEANPSKKIAIVNGTYGPLYLFEKNFKNVPFLSELFGKNVEESLLAADFKVKKNGNKTDFIFNPLSILTPGKTRNFFDIWE
tara:strand:- start:162 stop:1193 length:1032 start_codon:yes stop_codon:yes gene_type:complete